MHRSRILKFQGVSECIYCVVAFFDFDFVLEKFVDEVYAALGNEDSGLSVGGFWE